MHSRHAVVALALVFPLQARAAITQTVAFWSGRPGPPPTFAFQAFDEMGGARRLTDIVMSVRGSAIASATLENDTAEAITAQLLVGMGLFTNTVPFHKELPYLGAASPIDASVPLSASDGITGSGPDFFDFGIRSVAVEDAYAFSDHPYLEALLSEFTGSGVVPLTLALSGGWAYSGGTSSVVSEWRMTGEFSMTYEFELVPAPSALALWGLGHVALARRRLR